MAERCAAPAGAAHRIRPGPRLGGALKASRIRTTGHQGEPGLARDGLVEGMGRVAVRVLHIIGAMDPGGVETGLMRMLRAVDRQQCAMDFCCLSGAPGSYAPEITALGGEVLPCKVGRNPFAFARRLSALLCEGRYDVVHSHVHHFSGYILRIAARAGIPGRIAHSRSASDFKEGALARPL
ncbi:MAG: glycosyltransferase family 1 protein, partial [Chloroflexi bacterium]|nr:glycosyltransferase family 1 protein [Chloroflexota bacterium]